MKMVEAARDEAALAVRLYNDAVEVRSFEGFVVHMHLSWLYLLHAEFTRDGTDFRYWKNEGISKRLDKVDGEPKRWELARCVKERWPDAHNPIRANLAFFIGLRNKIEHRHDSQNPSLMVSLSGQCQSLLLNFEEELTEQFGTQKSLAARLHFPMFIGSFTTEGEQTLQRLRKKLPADLRKFIAEFDANLDPSTSHDPRYEFRLRVLQELAPKDPDALAIQYTRLDDLTEEEKAAVEKIGRKGYVVVREQKRPVVGHGLMKPSEIVRRVASEIAFRFTMSQFTESWRKTKVRPPGNTKHPARTDERYCIYDERHRDYGYTEAYAKLLISKCGTEKGYRALLGGAPRDKDTGEWVGTPPLSVSLRQEGSGT